MDKMSGAANRSHLQSQSPVRKRRKRVRSGCPTPPSYSREVLPDDLPEDDSVLNGPSFSLPSTQPMNGKGRLPRLAVVRGKYNAARNKQDYYRCTANALLFAKLKKRRDEKRAASRLTSAEQEVEDRSKESLRHPDQDQGPPAQHAARDPCLDGGSDGFGPPIKLKLRVISTQRSKPSTWSSAPGVDERQEQGRPREQSSETSSYEKEAAQSLSANTSDAAFARG